jgi:hypothetical protein
LTDGKIGTIMAHLTNALSEEITVQILTVVNDADTRERLSGPAIRGFLQLTRIWNLRTDEILDLLGASVSRGTLNNWGKGNVSTLSADQLMRISYLLAIYEGLQRIWRRAPAEADAWMRRPRPEVPFSGSAPLEVMRQGGIPAFAAIRGYIDGITGGPPSREDYPPPPRERL